MNDELQKTARTLKFVQDGMGKAKAIEEIWGCKKGSSVAYNRAKDLLEADLEGQLDV